jgi:hypothetical protein
MFPGDSQGAWDDSDDSDRDPPGPKFLSEENPLRTARANRPLRVQEESLDGTDVQAAPAMSPVRENLLRSEYPQLQPAPLDLAPPRNEPAPFQPEGSTQELNPLRSPGNAAMGRGVHQLRPEPLRMNRASQQPAAFRPAVDDRAPVVSQRELPTASWNATPVQSPPAGAGFGQGNPLRAAGRIMPTQREQGDEITPRVNPLR